MNDPDTMREHQVGSPAKVAGKRDPTPVGPNSIFFAVYEMWFFVVSPEQRLSTNGTVKMAGVSAGQIASADELF